MPSYFATSRVRYGEKSKRTEVHIRPQFELYVLCAKCVTLAVDHTYVRHVATDGICSRAGVDMLRKHPSWDLGPFWDSGLRKARQ